MAVDEVQARARNELAEVTSVGTADYVLDRPPGGWGDLTTKQDLADLEVRLDQRFTDVDRRFTDVDRRFSDVDRRFTETDRKIGELDKKFEYKFTELDKKLDAKIDALSEQVRMTISSTVDRAITTATWRLVTAIFAAIGIFGLLVRL